MKIKSKRKTFKFGSKAFRKKKKSFKNEIKEIIYNSFLANSRNRELTEANAMLLAEIESLKNEKLMAIKEFFALKEDTNPIIIKNDLMVLLETLKRDHNSLVQMFQTSNQTITQTISKINDKIEDLNKFNENRGQESEQMDERSPEEMARSQQIFELKQRSKESDENEDNGRLSAIREVTQELIDSNHSLFQNSFKSPEVVNSKKNSLMSYEMTPHFSEELQRTPSIYNFKCNSFYAYRTSNVADRTSLSLPGMSPARELSLSEFYSMDSTVTEDKETPKASTPVSQTRLSVIDMRQSKRLSSINRPYSPRIGRPSLINIQNVMENEPKNRKKSLKPNNFEVKSNASEAIGNQSNARNCTLNTTKRKRKKCLTQSMDSESSLDSNSSCNQSVRNSRRTRKPVSYKEPSLHSKIRRPNEMKKS